MSIQSPLPGARAFWGAGNWQTITGWEEYKRVSGFIGRDDSVPEATPAQVQQRLDAGEPLYILDVREPHEYREAHVPGSTLVPLGQLAQRVSDLPRDRPIVVICRSGHRSATAVAFLLLSGFAHVENLSGGIIAWAMSGGSWVPGGE